MSAEHETGAVPSPPSAPVPILSLQHATKAFGAIRALDDVSIDLYPGEAHALVGENGAGKSTLVKIFAGVHPPDSGRLLDQRCRGRPGRPGRRSRRRDRGHLSGADALPRPHGGREHLHRAPAPARRAPHRLRGDARTGRGDLRAARHPARPRPDRARPLDRRAAAGRDRQGPLARCQSRRHGRADGGALRRRGRPPLQGCRCPARVGRRGALHLAPARRGVRALPARDDPPRRPARSHPRARRPPRRRPRSRDGRTRASRARRGRACRGSDRARRRAPLPRRGLPRHQLPGASRRDRRAGGPRRVREERGGASDLRRRLLRRRVGSSLRPQAARSISHDRHGRRSRARSRGSAPAGARHELLDHGQHRARIAPAAQPARVHPRIDGEDGSRPTGRSSSRSSTDDWPTRSARSPAATSRRSCWRSG